MEKLNARKIRELTESCFFDEADIPPGGQPSKEYWAMGEGVVKNFVFDKRKIEEHREEIKEYLSQLPDEFFEETGSCFIQMPFDKGGNQWGEQIHAEMLMALGRAAGYIWYTPRMMWPFSFGVPMVIINFEGFSDEVMKKKMWC